MVKEIKYTSINMILDELHDHPMLKSVTLEQAVRYALTFIAKHAYPNLYQNKIENVEIENYRAALPCDLISIIQVKDLDTEVCLRAMTNTFIPGLVPEDSSRETAEVPELYIPPRKVYAEEPSFKTQGRIIYTSFPKGTIQISYRALPIDENGYPKIVYNEMFIEALVAYIKVKVFTLKFDRGEIAGNVLQNAKQDYAWASGQLAAEFTIPSVSEAEALSRMSRHLIPKTREFDSGFKNAGNREYLKNH